MGTLTEFTVFGIIWLLIALIGFSVALSLTRSAVVGAGTELLGKYWQGKREMLEYWEEKATEKQEGDWKPVQ